MMPGIKILTPVQRACHALKAIAKKEKHFHLDVHCNQMQLLELKYCPEQELILHLWALILAKEALHLVQSN